jgi:hypothetical protein
VTTAQASIVTRTYTAACIEGSPSSCRSRPKLALVVTNAKYKRSTAPREMAVSQSRTELTMT